LEDFKVTIIGKVAFIFGKKYKIQIVNYFIKFYLCNPKIRP